MSLIVWEDAVGTMAESSPASLDLLTLLGFLAPEPFPPRLLIRYRRVLPKRLKAMVADDASLGEAISALADDGLLTRTERGIALRQELFSVLRARLSAHERSAWCAKTLRLIRRAFPADCDDVRTWKACRTLLPHLSAVVLLAADLDADDDNAAWLRDRGAVYLLNQGEHAKALDLVLPAVRRWTTGQPTVLAGTLLRTLGAVRAVLDESELARKEMKRALAIHLGCVGSEHREIVRDRTALARVLESLDDQDGALEQLTQALDVDKRLARPDLSSCDVRLVMGWVLLQKGDAEAARTVLTDALTLAEECFGADHPAAAAARTGLGHVFQNEGDYVGARDEFERALSITEHALGPNHPEVSVDRSNLGSVLHELGEFDAARTQLARALEVAELTLPPGHRTVWMRERKLALLLQSMDDLDGAIEHGRRAHEISRSAVGPSARRTADDLSFIADVLTDMDDHRGACDAYRKVVRILEDGDDPDPRELANNASAVGRAAQRAGDLGTARLYYAKAVETYEQTEDPDRDDLIAARLALTRIVKLLGDELAEGFAAIGRDDRAADVRKESSDAFEQMFKSELEGDDPDAVYALAEACLQTDAWGGARLALDRVGDLIDGEDDWSRKLGMAWHRLGRACVAVDRGLALEAYEKAIPLLDGAMHLKGVVLHDLAGIRRDESDAKQATELFQQAADCKRRAAGDERDLVTTLHALARELERDEQLDEAEAVYREALELLESLSVREPRFEGVVLHDIADVKRVRDGAETAIDLYREAAVRKRDAGDDIDLRDLGVTMLRLGRALEGARRLDEALCVYEDRLDLLEQLPRRDQEAEAVAFRDLGDVLRAQDKPDEAAAAFEQALARARASHERPMQLAAVLMALGEAQLSDGKPELAKETGHEAASIYRESGTAHPTRLAGALTLVCEAALRTADREVALPAVDEALDIVRAMDDPDPVDLVALEIVRSRALDLSERSDEAVVVREGAVERLAELVRDDTSHTAWKTTQVIVGLAYETKAWDLAVTVAERALAASQGSLENPAARRTLLRYLGRARKEVEDYDGALQAFGELRLLIASHFDADPQMEGVTVHDIANVRHARGETEAAVELYREAVELKRRAEPARPRDLATTLIALGETALEAEQRDTAREALTEALTLTRGTAKDESRRIAKLEKLLERAGQGVAELV